MFVCLFFFYFSFSSFLYLNSKKISILFAIYIESENLKYVYVRFWTLIKYKEKRKKKRKRKTKKKYRQAEVHSRWTLGRLMETVGILAFSAIFALHHTPLHWRCVMSSSVYRSGVVISPIPLLTPMSQAGFLTLLHPPTHYNIIYIPPLKCPHTHGPLLRVRSTGGSTMGCCWSLSAIKLTFTSFNVLGHVVRLTESSAGNSLQPFRV